MKNFLNIKFILSVSMAATIIFSGCSAIFQAQHINSSDSKFNFKLVKPQTTSYYKTYESLKSKGVNNSGLAPEQYSKKGTVIATGSSTLPSRYSSADLGYTTPVRDQGNYSSCWAFSGLASLETYLLRNGRGTNIFAPKHATCWGTPQSDGTGWQRTYIDGGYPEIILGYLTSWSGPRNESDFPYNMSSPLTSAQINSGNTKYGVNGIIYLDDDRTTIKNAIMKYGSVVSGYNSIEQFYNDSDTSFYCPTEQSSFSGHAVTLVGWDDNYSKSNFTVQPSENGAWIIKNSWGNYNSLGGYFYISYDDAYLLTQVFGSPFSITSVLDLTDSSKIYQNEKYGATYDMQIQYSDNTSPSVITYMNVFNFTADHNKLDQVEFETQSAGANYNVYYIPIVNGSPDSNQNNWSLITNGTVPYNGYITADCKKYTMPVGQAAIGVTIDISNLQSGSVNTLGCDEWLSDTDNNMIFLPSPQRGQSYIKINNTLYDLLDVYTKMYNDNIGSTLVIKAISTSGIVNPTSAPTTIPTSPSTSPVTIAPTQAPTQNPDYTIGDVNQDGAVNLKDVTTIQKYLARLLSLNSSQLLASDINHNNKVELKDASILQEYLCKLIKQLP
ncbi:MAG: C1 family peptidase [Bacillota bacterium]|nr:C1 family peptidase [Bacillota bacterium]